MDSISSTNGLLECFPRKEVPSKSVLCRTNSLTGSHLSGDSGQIEMTQPSMSCLTLFATGGPASNEHNKTNGGALSHSANYYLNPARASDFEIFPKLAEHSAPGLGKPLSFGQCSLSSLYPVLSGSSSFQLSVSTVEHCVQLTAIKLQLL